MLRNQIALIFHDMLLRCADVPDHLAGKHGDLLGTWRYGAVDHGSVACDRRVCTLLPVDHESRQSAYHDGFHLMVFR